MSAQDITVIHPLVTLHQIRLLQKYTSVFQEATFERATRNSFLLLSVFLLRRDKHGPELQRTHVKVRSEKTLYTFCKSIQQKLNIYFSLKSRRLNLSDTSTCSWQNPFNFVQQPSFGVCVFVFLSSSSMTGQFYCVAAGRTSHLKGTGSVGESNEINLRWFWLDPWLTTQTKALVLALAHTHTHTQQILDPVSQLALWRFLPAKVCIEAMD